jgi:hypothetical protein
MTEYYINMADIDEGTVKDSLDEFLVLAGCMVTEQSASEAEVMLALARAAEVIADSLRNTGPRH